jgi:phage terminase large subunit GpA-like protein
MIQAIPNLEPDRIKNAAPILHHHQTQEMLQAYATVLRPTEQLSPSDWAQRYRVLKYGTTPKPGRWDNGYFPYLTSIMDCHQEAIEKGKRGLVLMKSGQGGGSEAEINCLAWCLDQYPGPALYLISKDEIAREFGRERFGYILESCEPLARKALRGRGSGELIHVKRFVDGKLVIQGGRSVLNLQSQPYRWVFIDEVDSLLDEIEGHGDPIRLAEIRTDSFSGQTLIVAFAHPSARARGAGKLYYELSDQRRGFVKCVHCGSEFWFTWDHVKVIPDDGLTKDQCERDPRYYHYFAPCCGAEISDAQRWAMARHVVQKSTLPAAEADRRPWVGVHFSQLYMSNKPLRFLAEKWVEGIDDDSVKRVFVNKRLGDVYDAAIRETTTDAWRRLIVVPRHENDCEFYVRGQVPRGVQFLTGGQDSNSRELHWSVWGWGRMRDQSGYPQMVGWLIDYGVVRREYSLTLDVAELVVFDGILYDRSFASTDRKRGYWVEQCAHDSGWQEIPVYEYCRRRPDRSVPSKGAAEDSRSSAPACRWGSAPAYKYGDIWVKDEEVRIMLLNTHTLKANWFGQVDKKFLRAQAEGLPGRQQTRLVLPQDVGDDFLEQASSEFLAEEKRKEIWKHKGPNHWSDCNIYAYACALNLRAFAPNLPFEEVQAAAAEAAVKAQLAGEQSPQRPLRRKY